MGPLQAANRKPHMHLKQKKMGPLHSENQKWASLASKHKTEGPFISLNNNKTRSFPQL